VWNKSAKEIEPLITQMTRIFQKVAEPLIIRFHPRYPRFSSSANVVDLSPMADDRW
jgi:hypothetical protein